MSREGKGAGDCRFAAHADFCGWHVDQYPWECDCGAIPDAPRLRREMTRTDRLVARGRERRREGNVVVTAIAAGAGTFLFGPAQCGERFAPGWHCTRAEGHGGPCAAHPRKSGAPAKQSKADSFMESLTNIAVGLAVSQLANCTIIPLVLGVPVSQRASLVLGIIYTAISLVRSYALRRAFNGRSVWRAIKDAVA